MKKSEKKLLELFRALPDEQAGTLIDFAEFLLQRLPEIETVAIQPLDIPRPDSESVIAAVKRLSATFPMLNKDKMLSETSALVAQNLVQGRNAQDVIDELEKVFRCHYETYLQENGAD